MILYHKENEITVCQISLKKPGWRGDFFQKSEKNESLALFMSIQFIIGKGLENVGIVGNRVCTATSWYVFDPDDKTSGFSSEKYGNSPAQLYVWKNSY